MTTTIQIEDGTLEILKKIKEETKSESYNEIIKELIKKNMKMKKSMFGIFKDKKTRTTKSVLRGLRDERDRF